MLLLTFLTLASLLSVNALRFPINKVRRYDSMTLHDKRASFSRVGKSVTFGHVGKLAAGDGNGDADLSTVSDALYMANVTIGGQDYQLQLDSGSSDLWVSAQSIPNSKPSSIEFNLTYGVGYANGQISQASVEFAGFTVPNQAFLLATQTNNPIASYGAVGILGMGFTSLSSIDNAVNGTGASWGRSFLYNVFHQDTSTPNFISFALERFNDTADQIQGEVTIGEYVSGLEAVQQMPAVPTWPEVNPNRWNVLLDAFFVNGNPQTLTSTVKGVPSGKLVSLLDTGTSYAYIDPNVVQTMYGGIKGATLDKSTGIWTVPCDAEVDITLVIGGNPIPLHPLDVVDYDVSNPKRCVGTFVGQQVAVGGGEFDWLFGDNILRSTYTIYDFGDFDSNKQQGNPYVKILSVTNATAASIDFHALRGGTANVTISASGVDVNGTTIPSGTSGTTATDNVELDSNVTKLLNYMPALLGVLAFNSLILLGLAGCAVIYFIRRGKGRKGGATARPGTADYHYQRVRSQYDPKDGPVSPNPANGSSTNVNGVSASARNSVRGSMAPPPPGSRHGSSASVHTLGNAGGNQHGQDEPFTPPIMDAGHEEPAHEGEGDVSSASIVQQTIPEHQPFPGHPQAQPSPPLPSGSTHLYDPNFMGVGPAPIPRQRFISSATTDSFGRPQSLFSVASGPLLSAGNGSQRPASTYDIPLGAPRPRFVSEAMSDGRPESTFSTAPLIRRGSGDGLSSPPVPILRRSSNDALQVASGGNGIPNAQQQHQQPFEEAALMTPPRPRFMSDVSAQPRPDSTFSMGSVGPNSAPLRPTSRYMDVSGPRPSSEAQ